MIFASTLLIGHRGVLIHLKPKQSHHQNGQVSNKHHHRSRGGAKHHHGHKRHRRHSKIKAEAQKELAPATPPLQRVQRILDYDHVNLGHEPQPLFSEMIELITDEDGKMEWHETAR